MSNEIPFRELNLGAKAGVILFGALGLLAAAALVGLGVWTVGVIWREAIGAWS